MTEPSEYVDSMANAKLENSLVTQLFQSEAIGTAILTSHAQVVYLNPILRQWLGSSPDSDIKKDKRIIHSIRKKIRSFHSKTNLTHQLISFPLHHSALKYPIRTQGILLKIDSTSQSSEKVDVGLICWLDERGIPSIELDTHSSMNKLIDSAPIGIISLNNEWECEFVNSE